MHAAEPEIARENILVVDDRDFNTDHVCIVTGCGSGIGRAVAVAMAVNGVSTFGIDINDEGGKQTQAIIDDLGGRFVFHQADLTKDDDVEESVAQALKQGQPKYLANIAGIQHIDALPNFPMEKYDLMQRLMLRAPFYLSKLLIPHMRRSADGTGVIGNMASIHAHICTRDKSVYNITKFGLRGLAQSISAEGEGKIRSFTVSTGYVKTPLVWNQIPDQARQRGITEEEVIERILGSSRIKEMMEPIDVANLFVFGFSRFSRYLIGGDLLYDGGVVLTY